MHVDLATVKADWAWAGFEPGSDRPWNRRMAAHLFRRAGFAASSSELDEAVQKTPGDVVASLLSAAEDAGQVVDADDPIARAALATDNAQNLAAWWLHRMRTTKSPLLEKMTLFWHGHFATSNDKVDDTRLMFAQNTMLRRHALGDFKQMVQEISRDPAMLVYLDSVTNRKAHPNENYAREVMELFCLGEGNYTERDIQELARCFTGWEIKRRKFHFNRYQHDTGQKRVLGQSGQLGGEEGVGIVLAQASCPRFIVRKLLRWFVADEPDAPEHLIEPLAEQLRADDLHLAPTVQRILSSNLFFSDAAVSRKVRSPVELGIGLLNTLDATTNLYRLSDALREVGQALFHPPNVKGWDGGRTWINTSTLLGRANLIGTLLRHEKTRFSGGTIDKVLDRLGIQSSDELVGWLDESLMALPLTESSREQLASLSPNKSLADRAIEIIHATCALPEFQLS